MKKLLYILIVPFFFIACEKNETINVIPPDISNIRSDSLPGQIVLRWDMPADTQSIHYIEVSYFDHRKQKSVINLSSGDSLLVDNTRHKYGAYQFKLTPYSFTRTPGNLQEYTGISGHAPIQETFLSQEKLSFTEAQITGNSIMDGGKNPPINLFDENDGTIYHARWSSEVPDIAWLDFDLQEEIKDFKINWFPRTNQDMSKPTDVDLMGSTDGENWFLIINLTKEKDGLPTTRTDWFRSPIYKSSQPFRYLRYAVNKTNQGHKFWTMSEMEIYKVNLQIVNPESPDYDEEY
ncbi:discoidin domain-containing protein [Sunxiuqinia sp. sy24]|uniref:discoidin domain-containing protein n=1 Tax=Sunxiuqinia sp. sy24 TaxID=3461495 RepID=UPI004045E2A1